MIMGSLELACFFWGVLLVQYPQKTTSFECLNPWKHHFAWPKITVLDGYLRPQTGVGFIHDLSPWIPKNSTITSSKLAPQSANWVVLTGTWLDYDFPILEMESSSQLTYSLHHFSHGVGLNHQPEMVSCRPKYHGLYIRIYTFTIRKLHKPPINPYKSPTIKSMAISGT